MFSFKISWLALFILISASELLFSMHQQVDPKTMDRISDCLLGLATKLLRGNIIGLLEIYEARTQDSGSKNSSTLYLEVFSTQEKGLYIFNRMIEKGIVKNLQDLSNIFKDIQRFDLMLYFEHNKYDDLLNITLKDFDSEFPTPHQPIFSDHSEDRQAKICNLEKKLEALDLVRSDIEKKNTILDAQKHKNDIARFKLSIQYRKLQDHLRTEQGKAPLFMTD